MPPETGDHPLLRRLADRLPEDGPALRAIRTIGKAVLSRKRLCLENRIVFEGVEDAVCERHLTVGPGPDEVLVETLFSAVSPGTERAYFLDLPNFHQERPYVPGYSGCGRVRSVGRRVTGLKKGSLVAGVLKHSSLGVVPGESLVPVPPEVAPREAAFVTLGVIALCGIRAAGDLRGRTVAVMGQGILGQMVDQLAKAVGTGAVVGLALGSDKRELAAKSGVDDFIALRERTEPLSAIAADIVIDATGSRRGFEDSLEIVKPGGRVVMLGSIPTYTEESDWPRPVVMKGIEVRGAHVMNLAAEGLTYREEAARFLGLLAGKKVGLNHLITDVCRPIEAPGIYRRLASGDRNILGIVIDWQNS